MKKSLFEGEMIVLGGCILSMVAFLVAANRRAQRLSKNAEDLHGSGRLARAADPSLDRADVNPSGKLLAGWIVYWVLVMAHSSISTYLSGSNFIKGQAILAVIHAGASFLLRVAFCKHGNMAGAVWRTILAYVLATAPAYLCNLASAKAPPTRGRGAPGWAVNRLFYRFSVERSHCLSPGIP